MIYSQDEEIRTNRQWVAIVSGLSREDDRNTIGQIVSFILPEVVEEERLENTSHNALWFYMNGMRELEYLTYQRVFNADDIHPETILASLDVKEPDPELITVNKEWVEKC